MQEVVQPFLFEWCDIEKSGGQKMFLKTDMLMAVL